MEMTTISATNVLLLPHCSLVISVFNQSSFIEFSSKHSFLVPSDIPVKMTRVGHIMVMDGCSNLEALI